MPTARSPFLFTARPDLDWEHVSDRFYDYTGMAAGDALGQGWLDAIHPDDREGTKRRCKRSAKTGQPLDDEHRLRAADGRYRWFRGLAEPVRGPDGTVVNWLGCCMDVHDRHTAEERERLLTNELQHRVRNVLSSIRAITVRTVETSTSLEDFQTTFEGRLSALARFHNMSVRTRGEGVMLDEIVDEEFVAAGAVDDRRVSASGPPVRLKDRALDLVGLALHELATNAVRHGALSAPAGRIDVAWRIDGEGEAPRLVFEWREAGIPSHDGAPRHRGFGRELIERALPYELDARTLLEFAPGSARCVIDLPLTGGTASPTVEVSAERPGDGRK